MQVLSRNYSMTLWFWLVRACALGSVQVWHHSYANSPYPFLLQVSSWWWPDAIGYWTSQTYHEHSIYKVERSHTWTNDTQLRGSHPSNQWYRHWNRWPWSWYQFLWFPISSQSLQASQYGQILSRKRYHLSLMNPIQVEEYLWCQHGSQYSNQESCNGQSFAFWKVLYWTLGGICRMGHQDRNSLCPKATLRTVLLKIHQVMVACSLLYSFCYPLWQALLSPTYLIQPSQRRGLRLRHLLRHLSLRISCSDGALSGVDPSD